MPRWRPVHRRYTGLAMSDKNVAAKLFCAEDVELKKELSYTNYSRRYSKLYKRNAHELFLFIYGSAPLIVLVGTN